MAGRIELITGPMFAGKTTELLMRREHYGRTMIAPVPIFPVVGSKHLGRLVWTQWREIHIPGAHWVVHESHDGRVFSADACDDLAASLEKLHEEWADGRLVLAIDEVQFFPSEIVPVIEKAAREWGWTVIAAGIDTDFAKYPWPTVRELGHIADTIIRLCARCAVCGGRAWWTQRLHLDGTPARADEPRVVLDDGSVRYEPRCLKCHVVA